MRIANVTRLITALVLGLTMTLALMFVVATGALPVPVAHAADIVVSSCEASDLIAAINTANGNGEDDTIILQTGCTFVLTTTYAADPDGYGPVGLPPITSTIVISGNGATISRSSSTAFRLIYVSDVGSLTLQDLVLTNGLAQGGNGGNSNGCGGGGAAGVGGAIFSRGRLVLSSSILADNEARGGNAGYDPGGGWGGGGGGGLGGDGASTTTNVGGNGGGINGGTGGLDYTNGGNATGIGGGGGGSGYGVTTGGNGGWGGGGGGAGSNSGAPGGNGGFGGGGGGYQTAAVGQGLGGFGGGNGGQWNGGGGGGLGGAVFNDGGNLTIVSSTLISNTAQGGNAGFLTSGNPKGNDGSGYGGAVFNYFGTLMVTDSTFADNEVGTGTGPNPGTTAANDIYDARINVIKTPSTAAALLDETVTYTYRIENTGTVTLTGISANDDKLGPITGISTTLYPGEFTIGTLTRVITTTDFHGPLVNIVVVTGTGTGGLVVTDTRTASIALLEYSLTLNTAGTGSGTVAKTPDLVKYQYGDVVTLAATPAPGSWFTDWSGDVTGTTNPITITMDGDKTVTATFTMIEYNVALNITGSGAGTATKEPDQPTFHYGDVITFTATAGTGSSFAGWSGDANGTASPLTLTVDGDKAVTATFTLIEYNLNASILAGNGSVARNPDKTTYHYGDVVTLTATPDLYWSFSDWSGDEVSTANPLVVTVYGDTNIAATFKQFHIYLPVVIRSN